MSAETLRTLHYITPQSAFRVDMEPEDVREAAYLSMQDAARQAGVQLDENTLREVDRQPFWQAKETLEGELAPRLIQEPELLAIHGIADDAPPDGYFVHWEAEVAS